MPIGKSVAYMVNRLLCSHCFNPFLFVGLILSFQPREMDVHLYAESALVFRRTSLTRHRLASLNLALLWGNIGKHGRAFLQEGSVLINWDTALQTPEVFFRRTSIFTDCRCYASVHTIHLVYREEKCKGGTNG